MQPDPLFDGRNVLKAALTALLGMAATACVLYAPYVPLYYRIALGVIGLGIAVFAAGVNIHLPAAPAVQAENIERMTVNTESPPPDPPPDGSPRAGSSTAVRTVARQHKGDAPSQ